MSSKIDKVLDDLLKVNKSRKEKTRKEKISKATKGKKKPRKTKRGKTKKEKAKADKGKKKQRKQRKGKAVKIISTDLSPKVVRDKKGRGDDITINITGKKKNKPGAGRSTAFAEKRSAEIEGTGVADASVLRNQQRISSDILGYGTQSRDPVALRGKKGRYNQAGGVGGFFNVSERYNAKGDEGGVRTGPQTERVLPEKEKIAQAKLKKEEEKRAKEQAERIKQMEKQRQERADQEQVRRLNAEIDLRELRKPIEERGHPRFTFTSGSENVPKPRKVSARPIRVDVRQPNVAPAVSQIDKIFSDIAVDERYPDVAEALREAEDEAVDYLIDRGNHSELVSKQRYIENEAQKKAVAEAIEDIVDEVENQQVEDAIDFQDVIPVQEDIDVGPGTPKPPDRGEKVLSAEEVGRVKNENKRLLANIKRKDKTFRSNMVDKYVRNYLDDPGPLDEFLFTQYPDNDDIQMLIREFVFNKNRILRSKSS